MSVPHLFWKVGHHMMKIFLVKEMLMNFVLFSSDILWKRFCATEHLNNFKL